MADEMHVTIVEALIRRELEIRAAIDEVRSACEDASVHLLRESLELVGCLRRLLPGRTMAEIHRAFGAPGDFGYETPIGAALAQAYSAKSDDNS